MAKFQPLHFTAAQRPNEKIANNDGTRSTEVMTQLLSEPARTSFSIADEGTWKIGWHTPVLICGFYISALCLAIGHFVFASSLNRRIVPLHGLLRQSYVSAISIGFALLFRAALTASLSACFVQRLWRLFRSKSLKVSVVDSLLAILETPLKLLHIEVLWSAKLEWMFALCFICIPIATVFPPGALTVELEDQHSIDNMTVPTFTPVSNINDTLAFHIHSGVSGVTPNQEVARAAARSVMAQSYLNGPSPCGQNCTYTLAFSGPDFQCQNKTSYQDLELEDISYDYSLQGGDYRAAATVVNGSLFEFEIRYYEIVDLEHEFDPELFLSCFLNKADYLVNVTYTLGTPTFDFEVNNSDPMNATSLLPPGTPSNSTNPTPGIPIANDTAAISDLNIWALYQSLVLAMSGSVGRYGEYDQEVNDTIVLDSALVQYLFISSTDVAGEEGLQFNISQASLNSMLHNITLSAISLNFWNTTTTVRSSTFKSAYSFSGSKRYTLILPYAACLLVSLVFVGIGLLSLYENGVAASNGFLQIIQTSRGSLALDRATRGSSLGGPDNVPRKLQNMEVVYGELKELGGKRDGGIRRAGWGTRDEVRPLMKGARYDG